MKWNDEFLPRCEWSSRRVKRIRKRRPYQHHLTFAILPPPLHQARGRTRLGRGHTLARRSAGRRPTTHRRLRQPPQNHRTRTTHERPPRGPHRHGRVHRRRQPRTRRAWSHTAIRRVGRGERGPAKVGEGVRGEGHGRVVRRRRGGPGPRAHLCAHTPIRAAICPRQTHDEVASACFSCRERREEVERV
jgi:hypothetical protein